MISLQTMFTIDSTVRVKLHFFSPYSDKNLKKRNAQSSTFPKQYYVLVTTKNRCGQYGRIILVGSFERNSSTIKLNKRNKAVNFRFAKSRILMVYDMKLYFKFVHLIKKKR